MRKMFIVWNEQRNEGFVTDDKADAEYALTGDYPQPYTGTSTTAEAFRDAYTCDGEEHHNFTMEEVDLP